MSGSDEPVSTRDVIYDRALRLSSRDDARLSHADRLLSAMVIFDSVCIADGVCEALYTHSLEELNHALAGYRFFGLHRAADVIVSIAERVSTEDCITLDAEYMESCPDTAIDAAYGSYYARHPDDFGEPSLKDIEETRSVREAMKEIARQHSGPKKHSVIVKVPLAGGGFGSDDERERVYALENELATAIDAARVGEFDGYVFRADTVTLFAFGPDAEALFAAMEGPLRRFNPPTGSSATLSFGGQDGPDDRDILLP